MNKLLFRSPLFYSFSNHYKVPYNINKQQHASYLKKVQRAQQQLTANASTKLIPRRKRRLYDRPRIDDNITGYGAWRVFQQQQLISKPNQHSMQVMKIKLQPKWLVHAFGIGGFPLANPKSANKQFHFQDNRFNMFSLYEYRNTTSYKPNKQGYNYEHQEHLNPRVRIVRRLEPKQFWNSQRAYQFRVNFSMYAERFKFKKWLLSEIYMRRKGKSYDQIIDQKYGKAVSFTSKQQSARFQPNQPMVSKVTPEHFNVGESTGKKGKKAEEQQPKVKLGSKLDQKYRIKQKLTPEQIQKQSQASQAAK